MKARKLFVATLLVFFACLACPANAASLTMPMEWVSVGDVNNPADPATGFGSVDHDYQIGKYEVTIGQYADFLNATAASDPHELYHPSMAIKVAGISRSGSSGSYSYSVIGSANLPVTYVSWYDVVRMANWMHNGQGSGSTETGAYNILGSGSVSLAEPGARYWIPTSDEWYKAAYYAGGGDSYWRYPTQSDVMPSNDLPDAGNNANFYQSGFTLVKPNELTDVGAFTGSASHYGTFGQGGNVAEWNDAVFVDSWRWVVRGGDWTDHGQAMSSSYRNEVSDGRHSDKIGFRLATIPEPSTATLAALGMLGLVCRRRRD